VTRLLKDIRNSPLPMLAVITVLVALVSEVFVGTPHAAANISLHQPR